MSRQPDEAEPDARCSEIGDNCVVGAALRRHLDPAGALREALESRIFRGVRPSLKPRTRAEAAAEIVAEHCSTHRPLAVTLLAAIAPGV